MSELDCDCEDDPVFEFVYEEDGISTYECIKCGARIEEDES